MKLRPLRRIALMALGSLLVVSLWQIYGHAQSDDALPMPNENMAPPPATSPAPQPTQVEPQAAPLPGPDQSPSSPNSSAAAIVSEVQTLLEPFIYEPKGRRDPFKPYAELRMGGEEGSEQIPLLPLQRFELDQLKLIGIIWDVEEPKAMFLDPNAEVYVIGKDERVGRRNGYIAAIREGEVVVVEASRVRGEVVYTSKILRIAR